jgi:hypothetical protein
MVENNDILVAEVKENIKKKVKRKIAITNKNTGSFS